VTVRLTVHAEDLRAAVDFAGKLCSTKPTQPILHGVLVEADERLTLSAFDGDLAGRVTVSARGELRAVGRRYVRPARAG
jgi:DNA polymerase-3 subunit beta